MATFYPGNWERREAPICYDLAEEQVTHRTEHEDMTLEKGYGCRHRESSLEDIR
jgi:hypothetical protein